MYATGEDLAERYDIDWIGELATDDREGPARARAIEHPNVITALRGASGQVDAALLAGGNYQPDDLALLVEPGLSYLKDIVCGLAMIRLWQRRAEAIPEHFEQFSAAWLELLDKLRNGDNLFNLPGRVEASIVDTGGPTTVDLTNRNDVTVRGHRYYPPPVTRLPRSQQGGI